MRHSHGKKRTCLGASGYTVDFFPILTRAVTRWSEQTDMTGKTTCNAARARRKGDQKGCRCAIPRGSVQPPE